MKTFKIFLASSFELKADRDQFEIFINRKNKEWVNQNIFLELVIWEDTLDCMELTRLQDKYNAAIKECDIFVLLFSTKVGEFTREEFEIAYDCFLKTKKPILFVYFKNITISIDKIKREDQKTLWAFQDRLIELQHLQTYYETPNDLVLFFSKQLDKLLSSGFFADSETGNRTQNVGSNKVDPIVIPHTLTLPPFKPELFLGRDEDLRSLKEKFFMKDFSLLFVTGEGGLGKTTLASAYFHTFQHDYHHVAWVLCESNICQSLISSLSKPLGIQYHAADTLQMRLEKLLLTMMSLPKPCLLVIDNADDPADLEEAYLTLRRCTNFHVLVTTRISKFHNVQLHPLLILPPEKALQLFKEHYPVHNPIEDGLFYKICDAIGGNTLVIEVLAKNLMILNQNENTYTLKNLLEDIQGKGLLATTQPESEKLDTTYHAESRITFAKPTEIIAAMYDLGNLSPLEIQLLSNLAVLPAERISYEVLEKLCGSIKDFKNSLALLLQKGWIGFDQSSRSYKCSPVIQEIVQYKNKNINQDCRVLLESLIDLFAYDVSSGHPIHCNFADASLYVHYAESAIKELNLKNLRMAILMDRIGTYFRVTGDLPKARNYFERYNHLSEELYQENPQDDTYKYGLAASYEKLGRIFYFTGDLKQTQHYFEQYKRLIEELYRDYPQDVTYKKGLVMSYEKLGVIFSATGDLSKAQQYFAQCNQLLSELYRDYPKDLTYKYGLAVSFERMGVNFSTTGDLPIARQYFEQCNQLLSELYQEFPQDVSYKYWLAVSFEKLGEIFSTTGDLPIARQYFEQYNQLIKELYQDYPQDISHKYGLAVSFEKLGAIFSSAGDSAKAKEYYEQCNQLLLELYRDYPEDTSHKFGLAVSFEKLGEIYSNGGDPAKAKEYYEQCNQLLLELYRDYPEDLSYQYELSVLYERLGIWYIDSNVQEARIHFEKAIKLTEELLKQVPENKEYQDQWTSLQKNLKAIGK